MSDSNSNGNSEGPTVEATPFLDGLHFGEGPRWHEGRLWFSDFFAEAVFSSGPDGDRRQELAVPGRPSGLGWLPDGRLLVVCMEARTVLRLEADGSLVQHGDLRPWATFHGNDMVVDGQGRAFAGNFGFDLAGVFDGSSMPCNTSLIRVDPDGSSHEAASDLSFPNGTVITPDGGTMIIAESFAGHLTAFDIASDGTLSGRRIWAPLPGVAPDGICLDAEGCVWVANAIAAECVRVAEGGRVVGRVQTSQPSFACMLGGDDRRTLYCCTAPTSEERLIKDVFDGKIEQAQVGVAGAGLP